MTIAEFRTQNHSPASLLKQLYALELFGIRPGLESSAHLTEFWANPQSQYPIVHVAGTNGKGAVCSMLASILQEAGYNVGLYTSPHLQTFNERIRINGVAIPDDGLIDAAQEILPVARECGATFFDTTTAIAFRWFALHNIDIAVIETGLGGRFDSTNIVDPELSVITPIDMDHERWLGVDLEQIAFEKAGIIKRETPVVVGEARADVRSVFAAKAHIMHAPIVYTCADYEARDIRYADNFTMAADIRTPAGVLRQIGISTFGAHQIHNAVIAIAAAQMLSHKFPIETQHIYSGLRRIEAHTGYRGRLQAIRSTPPVFLDVGHNLAGVKAVVAALQRVEPRRRWRIAFGAMKDKPVAAMLAELTPIAESLVACAPQHKRSLSAGETAQLARAAGIEQVSEAPSVAAAVRSTLSAQTPALILGSFFVADEALTALEKFETES